MLIGPIQGEQVNSREHVAWVDGNRELKRSNGGRLHEGAKHSVGDIYRELREYQASVNEEISILRHQIRMLRRLHGLPGEFHEGKK